MVEEKCAINAADLLSGVAITEVCGDLPETVESLCIDSRQVTPGAWFIALRGTRTDGHDYLPGIAEQGGVAAIVETVCPGLPLAQIVVDDTLCALPTLSANYFRHPANDLQLVGITGSNGKTSSTYLLESIWTKAGISCGVMGTIEYRWPGSIKNAPNTTPLALDLHRTLREMVDAGMRHAVLEVSSHALALHRVDGLRFSAAMFTNLSHDHLDFHPTMEDYLAAKARLFTEFLDGRGAINLDHDAGRKIFEQMDAEQRIGYAIDQDADVRAEDVHLDREGTRFRLVSPWGSIQIESALIGHHNLENLLGVCALALALALPLEAIAEGLAAQRSVPGRLESIENSTGATIVVDYAHTPDGLEKVLTTMSGLSHRKLITLMGCGGDRDKTKRPEMGEISLRFSDWVIVTSDNPRTEDPQKIICDIEAGMTSGRERYEVEPDRRKAIQKGLQRLEPGDIFVVAGKGHETYQTIGTTKHPFDDRQVVRALLAGMGGKA